ncbi:hypothetical protein [Paenibacillus sp. A14]|uniref:hypothetical protein n=1 Tax=Paenibacillus sp. A14 TaxID=3119820 RepID=UPI002FE3538D
MLLAEAADWPQMGSIKEGLMQRHCLKVGYSPPRPPEFAKIALHKAQKALIHLPCFKGRMLQPLDLAG